MGSFLSRSPIRKEVDRILESALQAVKQAGLLSTEVDDESKKSSKSNPLEASVRYLSREDVKEQIAGILEKCAPCQVDCRWKEMLGIVYLCMTCTREGSLVGCLNLWPCSTCACVAFTIFDEPVEKNSEEYRHAVAVFG
jgi:hypothetical protein